MSTSYSLETSAFLTEVLIPVELIQVPLQESFFSYLYLASPEVIPGLQKSMESPVKYFLRHKYMLHSLENLAQPGRQPESVFRLFFFSFLTGMT